MPFIANTPESLIGRTDSKNPATTCRGITSNGRPCRRPLAAGDVPVLRTKLGRLRADDPRDEKLYCWQHKDQASLSAHSSPGPRMSNTPILEERTSLDTLADRLGLLDLEQQQTEKPSKHARPSNGNDGAYRPAQMTRPKPKKEVSCCFCFSVPIEEASPPPRPQPRPVQATSNSSAATRPSRQQYLTTSPPRPRPSQGSSMQGSSRYSHQSSVHSTTSQTAQYLSLIPATASPQTASQLIAELAKPVSLTDEPGYIYMFWLTPESQQTGPPTEAARDLLAPPTTPPRGSGSKRRPSDVVASFATADKTRNLLDGGGSSTKVLLKIGRANNVQRRLNEWKRQCGYDLSLIRYYPYISSSSPGASATPRKMPHSHKVERLIHLELAGAGLRVADRAKCDACGKDHREWFQVEATRKGLTEVDDAIRRWVEWDERQS